MPESFAQHGKKRSRRVMLEKLSVSLIKPQIQARLEQLESVNFKHIHYEIIQSISHLGFEIKQKELTKVAKKLNIKSDRETNPYKTFIERIKTVYMFFDRILALQVFIAHSVLALIEKPVKLFSMAEHDLRNEWNVFKKTHKKVFQNKTHENYRYSIFKENLLKINEQNIKFNKGHSTYTAGVNQFTDMTSDEFMAFVSKGIKIPSSKISKKNRTYSLNTTSTNLPSSVDWRKKGYINPIRNQGKCECCWAFSAVSAIESYYFKANGILLSLSEQNLVDCTYPLILGRPFDGCDGGWMSDAFKYIIQNNGIATNASYPYISGLTGRWNDNCSYNTSSLGARISGFVVLTYGEPDEMLLTSTISNMGPIAVGVYASSKFQIYRSGVFTDSTCPNGQINHAVNLVGYGTLNGSDYYLLRNSWGTSWGIGGYMYFTRNTTGNSNVCSIASYASFPNVTTIPKNLIKSSTTSPNQTKTTQNLSASQAQTKKYSTLNTKASNYSLLPRTTKTAPSIQCYSYNSYSKIQTVVNCDNSISCYYYYLNYGTSGVSLISSCSEIFYLYSGFYISNSTIMTSGTCLTPLCNSIQKIQLKTYSSSETIKNWVNYISSLGKSLINKKVPINDFQCNTYIPFLNTEITVNCSDTNYCIFSLSVDKPYAPYSLISGCGVSNISTTVSQYQIYNGTCKALIACKSSLCNSISNIALTMNSTVFNLASLFPFDKV